MSAVKKWGLRLLLAFLVACVVVWLWKGEEIRRLLAVNTLFDADRIVQNFSNMDDLFLHQPVPIGPGPVTPLPQSSQMDLPSGADAWMAERAVTSLLVLHKGEIAHEGYYLGTQEDDLRISWSVAKSYISALLGVVLNEGAIASLDDRITKYVPSLVGTAYDGATIRNVLHMSSGVVFNEAYLEYDSDINRMGRELALGGTLDGFTAGLSETFAAPGETWKYVSIDTHVIGMVIRGATGRGIAELLSEKIISRLGLEKEPIYLTDGEETAFVLGGLNITTRDYARFGVMIAQGGAWNGQQIVPAEWIAESTKPSANTAPGKIRYGYQWWIPQSFTEGQFLARGIYGQYIFIDPARDVVIVMTAADKKFRQDGANRSSEDMFLRIAAALEK